ncbi:MAG: SOS response-associated peptidase, partial [Bacteroidota bacterium]
LDPSSFYLQGKEGRRVTPYKEDWELEKELERIPDNESVKYYVNGFEHPMIPVITAEDPLKIQFLEWGLIPSWTKDRDAAHKLSSQTINARAETVFDKPAFRNPARYRRCIVIIDAFFEYYHFNESTYPFHVSLKSGEPMLVAGVYDTWIANDTGEIRETVSIITTKANPLMKIIHNNPKSNEPRMPAIFEKGKEREWMMPASGVAGIQKLKELLVPYPESRMIAYPVGKLRGKEGSGNTEKAIERKVYPELEFLKLSDLITV